MQQLVERLPRRLPASEIRGRDVRVAERFLYAGVDRSAIVAGVRATQPVI